ncbi:non-motor microtubule binding protein [Lithospermum erythrorhizon]|uniref:Non-motor microtubule binding protein n=1 Tax=Lithospermum erythrorhizon TaxID=34254 RepID=A0AAV3NNB2_LITER
MALRSLDNALPIALERPKKQPKSSAISTPSLIKQTDIAMNDENKAPCNVPPQTLEASIEYILSENLKPLTDPETKIQGLVGGLESKDWLVVCESLNDVRRFALFHFSILQPLLEKVLMVIVKAMKNPRSALCKTSIMASSDIFKAAGDILLELPDSSDAFQNVMLQLLMKASQDKKFVCEEAEKALKTLVDSLTPLPLLQKLRANVSHSNMRVRAKAAVSISNCVSKMEQEETKEFGLVELIKIAANMLNDRLPEARDAARKIIVLLYEAVTKDEEEKHESWQNFCQENLSATDTQAMVKLVSS